MGLGRNSIDALPSTVKTLFLFVYSTMHGTWIKFNRHSPSSERKIFSFLTTELHTMVYETRKKNSIALDPRRKKKFWLQYYYGTWGNRSARKKIFSKYNLLWLENKSVSLDPRLKNIFLFLATVLLWWTWFGKSSIGTRSQQKKFQLKHSSRIL